ncbi:MAG: helix-turn-helix domain-containing protein [Epsilonproteobacteria bacterium]|nr:helix-turn-helix domain-containing protein [Campylobacterota bacterium]
MLAININSPKQTIEQLRDNFKAKRLSLNLTQEGLANKSGVSLGSLKRFETTGKISLESLLSIAYVLDCLDDFLEIATHKPKEFTLMSDLLKQKSPKKRGTLK